METSKMFTVGIQVFDDIELELVKENIEKAFCNTNCIVVKAEKQDFGGYSVQLMLENPSMLFRLGLYVGADKKRIHNLDC